MSMKSKASSNKATIEKPILQTFSELAPSQRNCYISLTIQQSENNQGIRMIRPGRCCREIEGAYA